MRRALVLALVALIGSLAVRDAAAGAPAPSGFTVQPTIADPSCNGGHGIRFFAPVAGDQLVASGTLTDGSTLIAVSQDYPGASSTVLYSITRQCKPNSAFGVDGVTRVGIPGRGHPAPARLGSPPPPPGVLWIETVTPTSAGAILAGTYGDDWVVGEVTTRGRLVPTFGHAGWTLLPYRGQITAVLPEPSGRIVIAGDNNGGGCCTLNWAAALSATGKPLSSFGGHGREQLPTGEDSGVGGLELEPNGDILAKIGYGNMGCWGLALAMLAPSGRAVPDFASRLSRFWQRLDLGAFQGDAYIDGDGFTLIGTGQKPCADGPTASAPSARGLVAHFRPDGQLIGQPIHFASTLLEVQAFGGGTDAFIATSVYLNQTNLTLTALHADGTPNPRFGTDGEVKIQTPWKGKDAALDTTVWYDEAGPGEIVVIATTGTKNQVQLIRLHV